MLYLIWHRPLQQGCKLSKQARLHLFWCVHGSPFGQQETDYCHMTMMACQVECCCPILLKEMSSQERSLIWLFAQGCGKKRFGNGKEMTSHFLWPGCNKNEICLQLTSTFFCTRETNCVRFNSTPNSVFLVYFRASPTDRLHWEWKHNLKHKQGWWTVYMSLKG